MTQKLATEMTDAEYEAARAAAIRGDPGLTAAERADLASRCDDQPKDARSMSDTEYEAAKSKLIRDSY
jgi:hypothetical protein